MSLHRKIIGWFVVFAALTIIVFGLGDYIQTTRALRFALETRSASLALQVAGDVDRKREAVEGELRLLGHLVVQGDAASLPTLAHRYRHIEVVHGADVLHRIDTDRLTQAAAGCGVAEVSFDVPFATSGREFHVRGRIAARDFFEGAASLQARMGEQGVTAVLEARDGSLVYHPSCNLSEAAPFEESAIADAADVLPRLDLKAGQPQATDAGDRRMLTATRLSTTDWLAVVSLNYAEFAAPFVQLRRQYFGIMGAVLVCALLLVLGGIRSDMRRLAAISSAADAIGHGRFDVWLPPPTGDEIGRVSLALGRMTERLSSSLRQIEVSRSMAAVGELSTYLSHEIRNPLSSIRLNLQMLRRDLRGGSVPDDGEQLVGLCLAELERLDDVVKTVLEVGRTTPQARGDCNAHTVVNETLRVMRHKFATRGVTVLTSLRAAESDVGMTSAALRGIVMNLVLNSADALGGMQEGRITVATQLIDADGEAPRLELRVADNGPGVPAHLRERIFDPFFTTKPSGNGIGLPTALRAVQECGGVMRYDASSELGTGAEFVVELPLLRRAVQERAERTLVRAGV
jgi:signal transduction histidine kinase